MTPVSTGAEFDEDSTPPRLSWNTQYASVATLGWVCETASTSNVVRSRRSRRDAENCR